MWTLNHKRKITVSYLHTFAWALSTSQKVFPSPPPSSPNCICLVTSSDFPPLVPSFPLFSGSLHKYPGRKDNFRSYTLLRGYFVCCQSSYLPWGHFTFNPVSSKKTGKKSNSALHSQYSTRVEHKPNRMEGGPVSLNSPRLRQELIPCRGFQGPSSQVLADSLTISPGEDNEEAGSPGGMPRGKDTLPSRESATSGLCQAATSDGAVTPPALPPIEGGESYHKSLLFISCYIALSPTFSSKLLLCHRNKLIQQEVNTE